MATKIPKFRTVDPHTLAGGGPELTEMVRFSTKTWLIIKFFAFWFKHRVVTFVVAVILGTAIFESAAWQAILVNLIIFVFLGTAGLYAYTYSRYAYAPTFWRLTQAIRRRWWVHKHWPLAVKAAGFTTTRKLQRVRYTPNGMVGIFPCDQGKSSEDLSRSSIDIAAVLRAHEIKIDCAVPYEARLSIAWGDPTERILFPEDLSEMQTGQEDRITFALDSDHQPLELSLATSVLIIGESDSGKSNCLWSILNGLNEKEVPYKLWIIDPAGGVELDALEDSSNTIAYASSPNATTDLIRQAYNSMQERLGSIKGDTRKYKRSVDEPLNIILVDEFLLLPRFDQDSPLGYILSSGRKAGFIVLALSQLSQIDALGRTRDLFPQRICHATKSVEMTDAALGSGAEAAGAKCSRISKRTPGVGYYFSLSTRLYTRFRTPLITDENTHIIASGNLIQRTVTGDPITSKLRRRLGRRTSVYLYYGEYGGELGRLLYVGIAYDPDKRYQQHSRDPKEPWFPRDLDESLTEIEWFMTRKEAKERETYLIQTEHPVYNKQERVDF